MRERGGAPSGPGLPLRRMPRAASSEVHVLTDALVACIPSASAAPGGCTIAGLLTLEDGGLRSTVARTIQAATEHAAGLGKPKK